MDAEAGEVSRLALEEGAGAPDRREHPARRAPLVLQHALIRVTDVTGSEPPAVVEADVVPEAEALPAASPPHPPPRRPPRHDPAPSAARRARPRAAPG